MVTRNENGLVRVTVTLEPIDVDLLDRLAALEGSSRSAQLRALLVQVRPMISDLVGMFESVQAQRETLDEALKHATVSEIEAIAPELEEISRRFLGAVAKLEGAQTAGSGDAPASNTGATNQ